MARVSIKSTNINNLKIGELRAKWNASGSYVIRYYIDISHKILDLHKEVSAPEIDILQNKVDVIISTWDKKFEEHEIRQSSIDGKLLATQLEVEADISRQSLRSILSTTLKVDDTIRWDALKSNEDFKVEQFKIKDISKNFARPKPNSPIIGIWDKLTGKAAKKLLAHELEVERISVADEKDRLRYEAELRNWNLAKDAWNTEQEAKVSLLKQRQIETNAEIEKLRLSWIAGENDAIVEYATMVLDASAYPDIIQKNFDIQYEDRSKTLLIDYELPAPDDLPLVKSVRFVSSTGELKETNIAQKDAKDLYDELCYQLCLRTVHEVLESDTPRHVERVVFNGITDTVDKKTGNNAQSVIMSLMVDREEFLALNLARVEPKSCFKSLKGVAASSLAGLAAVPPIMKLDKVDKRFIDAQLVSLEDGGSTNLASMDWEDFEHLVREIFEKEFSLRGGEVKVTRSSADGGVDAVAFDPDPISGGKIIIQAKRYTKTVGVSAVRDLFGTTLAEGASKGILVTTADFGPDAHKFALGKPLTLLNGSNLLHLLQKHGMKARIDISEARKDLGLSH